MSLTKVFWLLWFLPNAVIYIAAFLLLSEPCTFLTEITERVGGASLLLVHFSFLLVWTLYGLTTVLLMWQACRRSPEATYRLLLGSFLTTAHFCAQLVLTLWFVHSIIAATSSPMSVLFSNYAPLTPKTARSCFIGQVPLVQATTHKSTAALPLQEPSNKSETPEPTKDERLLGPEKSVEVKRELVESIDSNLSLKEEPSVGGAPIESPNGETEISDPNFHESRGETE